MITLYSPYRLSPAVRSILVYTGANFLNKGGSFLLLFYFTHFLTTADFGMLNLFSNGVLFFVPFVSLGVLQSTSAEYFKLPTQKFADFFSSSMILPVIFAFFFLAILGLGKDAILVKHGYPLIFIAIPVVAFFNFLNEQLIAMIRNEGKPILYFIVSLGRFLAEALLAIYLVSTLKQGWFGRANAFVFSYLAISIYAIFYFRTKGYFNGNPSLKIVKSELIYSLPIILMQLSVFFIGSCGGYFIVSRTGNLNEVGIYSIAATYSSLVLVFCTALLQYSIPRLFQILSQQNPDFYAIKKQFLFYALLMMGATVLIIFAAPLAFRLLLQPEYLPGIEYCLLICTGHFCWSISYYLYNFLLFKRHKTKITIGAISAIVVSLVLNYFLGKYFNAGGVAMAMLLVNILVLAIVGFLVNNELKNMFISSFATKRNIIN